jgi:hypothetical protein
VKLDGYRVDGIIVAGVIIVHLSCIFVTRKVLLVPDYCYFCAEARESKRSTDVCHSCLGVHIMVTFLLHQYINLENRLRYQIGILNIVRDNVDKCTCYLRYSAMSELLLVACLDLWCISKAGMCHHKWDGQWHQPQNFNSDISNLRFSRLKVAAFVASFWHVPGKHAVVNGVFISNYVRLLSVLVNGHTPFSTNLCTSSFASFFVACWVVITVWSVSKSILRTAELTCLSQHYLFF